MIVTSTGIALGILLFVYLGLFVSVWRFAGYKAAAPADAALVLGAAVYDDVPSPVFQARIDHAIALYESQMVERIIFTGGRAPGDRLAESEAAREYAQGLGVPREDIYIETSSTTTWENLVEASAVIEAQGIGSIILVSDPMHMRRAVAMARDLGLEVSSSPTPTTRFVSLPDRLRFAGREALYLGAYLLRRR